MQDIINCIKTCPVAPSIDKYKQMFVGVDMTSIVNLMPNLLRSLIDYWWQHANDGIANASIDIYNNAMMTLKLTSHSEYYQNVVLYAFRRFLRYWWPRGNDKMFANIGAMNAFEVDKVVSSRSWIKIFLKLAGTIDKFIGYAPRYSRICVIDDINVIDIIVPKTIAMVNNEMFVTTLTIFDICRYIWRNRSRINSVMYIVTEYYDGEFSKPIPSSWISRFKNYCRLFQHHIDISAYGVIMSILIFHYDLQDHRIQTLLRFVTTKAFRQLGIHRISEAIHGSMQRHTDINTQRIIIDAMFVATMNMYNITNRNKVIYKLIKLKANDIQINNVCGSLPII